MSLRLNQILGGADIRSPIFYDSNDTGYYLDPASTSRLNTINVGASGVIINNGATAPERNLKIKAGGSGTSSVGLVLYDSSDTFRCQLYSEPSNYGFLDGLWASWDIRKTIGGSLFLNNNTTYYLNPASTTNLNDLYLEGDLRMNGSDSYIWMPNNNSYSTGFYDPVTGMVPLQLSGPSDGIYIGNTMWISYNKANNNSYNENIRLFNANNSVSVIAFSSTGISGTPTTSILGYSDRFETRVSDQWQQRIYSGYVEAYGSFRAPIFYDSANTSFYVDPATGTVLDNFIDLGIRNSTGVLGRSVRIEGVNDASGEGSARIFFTENNNGSPDAYGVSITYNGTGSSPVMPSGMTLGGANAEWAFWGHDASINGTKIMYGFRNETNLYVVGSVRSPIFYDSDNTGYYLNPAGLSQLSAVYANDWFRAQGNTGLYFQDKGYGITSAGAAGNSYGNASTYGTGLNGWQGWGIGSRHVFMSTGGDNVGIHDNSRSWLYYWNGSYHQFSYGYFYAEGSVRSPIFYDSDNTGYYIDAAGVSIINTVTSAQYYTTGWFRNNSSGNGLYNETTTQHFYSDDVSYWNVASSSGAQGIRFRTGGHAGTVRGYVYANDSNDVGLLNNGGNWRARVVGGDYFLADGSSIRGQIFYDSNNTSYYIDAASTSNLNGLNVVDANLELYKSQTVDMSNTTTYSTSNYYPVTIPVPTEGCIIQIQNNLNSNVPSWATHGSGFTLNLKWRTNGFGWGTTQVRRIIDQYFEQFTNQTICGGITQMGNSSTEVVWLRGGGQYYFKFSRNLSATAQSATYTVSSQSVSPTSTAQNTIWSSAGGSSIQYNDQTISTTNMYTPVLYDWNNSAYYVDPASTSNLVGLTVANTITGSITGNAGGSSASCTGNAATATRTSGQSGYPHAGTGMFAFYNWGGSDGGTSAPSASTYTTGLSVGSNPGDQAYGFQIANNMWNTGLWTRNYNSGFGSWIRLLDSSNYVGYSAFTGNVDGTQFRDANNTAYYIDPASTSNLVGLTVANTITGAVSGNAGSVTINYNNDSNSTYQMLWGSGNNVYGTAGVYLNPSTDVLYANAFYDAGNTAYYLDPNSTSNLLLVKTRNTFGERIAVTAASSTTIDTQYNVTELTMSTNVSLTLSNIQSSGTVHMWTIVTVGNGTAYSIGWPAAIKWPGGTAPTITSTNTKRDIYQFVTYDGGTTIYAIIVGQNL